MEKRCIRFVEKELMNQLPEDIWEQNVEVRFSPTKYKGYQDIQFHGPDYILRVRGIYRGRDTVIQHQLWHKDAATLVDFQNVKAKKKIENSRSIKELCREKRGA